MGKNLVLLFDGTWNTESTDTNIGTLKKVCKNTDTQKVFYDTGVGTGNLFNKIVGGVGGYGLSQNILDGYKFIVDNYEDGDNIYLYGFSRGAYTARSLSGLINRLGIPDIKFSFQLKDLYKAYRNKLSDYDILPFKFKYECKDIRIKFIGVFDTVGSLGLPVYSWLPFSGSKYQFHNTSLTSNVDYAYHAVAIDEHRNNFKPTLWTSKHDSNIECEQRWFMGCHSDVGGGLVPDIHANNALKWMISKSMSCGLEVELGEIDLGYINYDYLKHPIFDSYEAMLSGWFKFIDGSRYYRPIGNAIDETIDDYVFLRYKNDETYRPKNLIKYIKSNEK